MKSQTNEIRLVTAKYLRNAQPLSRKDPYFVHKSILRSLLTDVERFLPGTKGLDRDLVTFEARLEHEGIGFFAVALSSLGKALDQGLSDGRFTIPTGFKSRKGQKIPLLLGGIFCEVFDPSTGDLVRGESLTLRVSLLRQLLYFLEEIYSGYDFSPSARPYR